jgi:DNA-binding XRE family transcriptional regulator
MSRTNLWTNNIEKPKKWLKEFQGFSRGDCGNLTIQELFIINLKAYRKLRGVSQMRLAELYESSSGYIGEIESGKRFPSVTMIEKIASALNVESWDLFKNEPVYSPGKDIPARLSPV